MRWALLGPPSSSQKGAAVVRKKKKKGIFVFGTVGPMWAIYFLSGPCILKRAPGRPYLMGLILGHDQGAPLSECPRGWRRQKNGFCVVGCFHRTWVGKKEMKERKTGYVDLGWMGFGKNVREGRCLMMSPHVTLGLDLMGIWRKE